MQSRAKLLGHPIHQMLVPIPLGLFVVGAILDVVFAITRNPTLATVSFFNIVIGVAIGIFAAFFGFWDWMRIPPGTRAKRVGAMHGIGNVVVTSLFVAAVLLRHEAPGYSPSAFPIALEIVGLLLAGVTGWLGGELIDRLGVGVDDGANLDAPSSLLSRR